MPLRSDRKWFPSSKPLSSSSPTTFPFGRWRLLTVVAVWLCACSPSGLVRADWGDYADHTFQCPALTTCQRVCVANVTDCPAEMTCNGTMTLCPDGSCSAGPCDPTLSTPCAYACASVACAKVIHYYDSCLDKYGGYYDNETACGEAEEEAVTNVYTFTEPVFVGLYCFFGVVTFLVVVWCAYNQRLDPIQESTQPLQVSANDPNNEIEHQSLSMAGGTPVTKSHAFAESQNAPQATQPTANDQPETVKAPSGGVVPSYQTGYRLHPVGFVLWMCVLVILVGIQGLLAYLTIMYYVQQDAITKIPKAFEDEVQVLLAFEYVWST
jgi:hypothetical protein